MGWGDTRTRWRSGNDQRRARRKEKVAATTNQRLGFQRAGRDVQRGCNLRESAASLFTFAVYFRWLQILETCRTA